MTPIAAVGTGLRSRRLSAEIEGAAIVSDVDLDVAAGQWVAIIGPNGAGKTTLLRAVMGLQEHSGVVEIGGRELHSLSSAERARLVALVPQDPVIPYGVNIFDYVLLGRTPHLGLRLAIGPDDERVVMGVLQRLDLEELAGRPLTTLSGGERQRAVIARALAQDPSVLLLDEPTSSLDLGHQQEVLELVNDLRTERGLTVLMTMHDLNLAAQFADRLVLLSAGSVAADGMPTDVLHPELLRSHYGADVVLVDGPNGPVVVHSRRSRADPD